MKPRTSLISRAFFFASAVGPGHFEGDGFGRAPAVGFSGRVRQ